MQKLKAVRGSFQQLLLFAFLLITALLITPAAAARPWSASPEGMALRATLIAAAAVIGGLGLSLLLDTPAGPGIVVTAAAIFALSQAAAALRGRLAARG